VLGQIGECEAFLWSFQLNKIAIKLDLVVFVLTYGKTEKHWRAAGITFVDETNVFGFVTQERRRVRNGLRLHVCEHAAVGALEADLVLKLASNPLIFVNYDCHAALYSVIDYYVSI